jgi:hypothetical protein
MMTIAFTSAVGEFSNGIDESTGSSYLSGLDQLKADISRIAAGVSLQTKTGKEISSLLSRLKEAVSKL